MPLWRETTFSLPGDNLHPGTLHEVVKEILPQWSAFEASAQKRVGGSGHHCFLSYGSGHSYLFVDVIARTVLNATHVDVLVRGVQ